MNAIQLLKDEHEKARRAFSEIQAAGADQRATLWAKLEPELKLHEQMEEAALYGPVAQEAGSRDPALKEWHEQHHDEVLEAEAVIEEIGGMDPSSDEWMEQIAELQETLEEHIEKEEGDIWPRIEQVWDQSKLEGAGQRMETMKRQSASRAA